MNTYRIILGVLVLIALLLVAIIVAVLSSGKKSGKKTRKGNKAKNKKVDYYDDEDDDEYDDEEDEEDDYDQRRLEQRVVAKREETQPIKVQEIKSKIPARRQWKIILENVDTEEAHSIVFYDNVGIGRGRNTSEFEKFIAMKDDPRVSKIHCAIILNNDCLYLKDLESRNGTYLNGDTVQQPVTIQKDDVIGVGQSKLKVKKILRERR